jgi:hypothetical protein
MTRYRRALVLLLLSLLALTVCLVGACQPPVAPQPQGEADATLDGLNQDIQILLTLNRLDLKAEPAAALLATIGKMTTETQQAEAQRQAALTQLIPLLREKRAGLLQDQQPGDELEGKIREAQGKLDEAGNGIATARGKYVVELKKTLSPAQIAIITGADEANAQAEELLNWIRELPDAEYAEEAKSNADELADPESGLPGEAILKVFNEARKMSKADYERSRGGLVGKLAKLYMPMAEAADESLAEWFANPRLADLLRERQAKPGG